MNTFEDWALKNKCKDIINQPFAAWILFSVTFWNISQDRFISSSTHWRNAYRIFFFMIPSYFNIEILAKCCSQTTLCCKGPTEWNFSFINVHCTKNSFMGFLSPYILNFLEAIFFFLRNNVPNVGTPICWKCGGSGNFLFKEIYWPNLLPVHHKLLSIIFLDKPFW